MNNLIDLILYSLICFFLGLLVGCGFRLVLLIWQIAILAKGGYFSV